MDNCPSPGDLATLNCINDLITQTCDLQPDETTQVGCPSPFTEHDDSFFLESPLVDPTTTTEPASPLKTDNTYQHSISQEDNAFSDIIGIKESQISQKSDNEANNNNIKSQVPPLNTIYPDPPSSSEPPLIQSNAIPLLPVNFPMTLLISRPDLNSINPPLRKVAEQPNVMHSVPFHNPTPLVLPPNSNVYFVNYNTTSLEQMPTLTPAPTLSTPHVLPNPLDDISADNWPYDCSSQFDSTENYWQDKADPIYVNAKQYRRIMIRRHQREMLYASGRLPRENRRKYLHQSRHLHAQNRIRGKNGRFATKDETDQEEVFQEQKVELTDNELDTQIT